MAARRLYRHPYNGELFEAECSVDQFQTGCSCFDGHLVSPLCRFRRPPYVFLPFMSGGWRLNLWRFPDETRRQAIALPDRNG